MPSLDTLLGGISEERFLDEFWQKKPLSVKNALPDLSPLIEPDELAGFAMNEEIYSRLIFGEELKVEYGPFDAERFLTLPERHWSLLVNGMDLWSSKIKPLISYLDFLPRWRFDDIMVNYSSDGGNVGAHYDHYDVFLIQGLGRKSWKLGGICDEDTSLSAHNELRVIDDFNPERELVMSTGDLLYLPPQYAHFGTSIGKSITYSIGFRMPSCSEILGDLSVELISKARFPKYVKDPELNSLANIDHISNEYVSEIRTVLLEILSDDSLLLEWFAKYMTEPKYPEVIDITNEERVAIISSHEAQKEVSAISQHFKKFKNGRLVQG